MSAKTIPIPARAGRLALDLSAIGPALNAAARLAADAHRLLIASFLHLEAAGAVVSPEAEADMAELLEDVEAYADELLRVADDFGYAEVSRRLGLRQAA